MIDIETRKIVDLIESRELEEVEKWLKKFKNIEVISRDGSITYNTAATNAHPNAIQVSDRFHILKNLTEYGKEFLKRLLKKQVLLTDGSENIEQTTQAKKYNYKTKWDLIILVKELKKQGYRIADIAENIGIAIKTVIKYNKIPEKDREKYDKCQINDLKKERHRNTKWELIQDVQKEYKKCNKLSKVANKFNIDKRTVKKYLNLEEPPIHASTGVEHSSKLDKYKSEIIQMVEKGISWKIAYDKIKEKGFNGSESLLRTFIAKIRKNNVINNKIEHIIERKTLICLLYKQIDRVKNITKKTFDKFIEMYPEASQIYEIIKSFKEIVFGKKVENLDSWIKETKSKNIPEVNSFINGIGRDIVAVENAIKYDYNNGLAEGTVNKIKVVKRIMYGRCSFELLRKKLLLL